MGDQPISSMPKTVGELLASNKTAKNSWIASLRAVSGSGIKQRQQEQQANPFNDTPFIRPQRNASNFARPQDITQQLEQTRITEYPQYQQQRDNNSQHSGSFDQSPLSPPQMSRDTWSSSKSSQQSSSITKGSSYFPITTHEMETPASPSKQPIEPLSYSDFANGKPKGPPVGSMAGPYRSTSVKKKKSKNEKEAQAADAKKSVKARIQMANTFIQY
ncbi:UNVERIFIED_CONTAM: hypothetical protein HDU68_002632 [Siphonaria sp. JEL0065]|nr:hypothetical protein HDU68_002632 [Siphonaria sp. JEL0065]